MELVNYESHTIIYFESHSKIKVKDWMYYESHTMINYESHTMIKFNEMDLL